MCQYLALMAGGFDHAIHRVALLRHLVKFRISRANSFGLGIEGVTPKIWGLTSSMKMVARWGDPWYLLSGLDG